MNATMTERFNVSGALLVKLFGRPAEESAAFSGRAGRVRDIGVTSAMYSRTFFVALALVASLAQALVYGLGGWYALNGRLDAGTVVTLALLLTRLYGPLTALSNVRVDVMSALVSFERVFEVLDLPPLIDDAPDAVPLPAGARSIEFARRAVPLPDRGRGLAGVAGGRGGAGHRAGHRAGAARGVVHRRARAAGRAGRPVRRRQDHDSHAGAAGLRRRPAARCWSAASTCGTATLESLRDAIGVVTQDAHLFHETIAENLRYAAPDAHRRRAVAGAGRPRRSPTWSRSLPDGLDTVVGERGYRFSGGEKQRLAIARLLLKAPSIVILDEATAHLDSESEAAVQRALSAALAGRTSLVIAHRLSTVREADQILVVDGGRIVERGPHEELLARRRPVRRAVPHPVRTPGSTGTGRAGRPSRWPGG